MSRQLETVELQRESSRPVAWTGDIDVIVGSEVVILRDKEDLA